MFNNSIDSKPTFTKPDGEIVKDLTQPFFELRNRNYVKYEIYRVPKDYVMRPDLISKAVYNSSEYAELILKYNGISNPFSINEGDIILIPDLDSAKEQLKIHTTTNSENTAAKIRDTYKYLDPLKIPKKGKELVKFDNRQIVDAKEGALPPNFAEEGTSQITHRNGRVYFGDDSRSCLESGMSSSEFLTTIIKSK